MLPNTTGITRNSLIISGISNLAGKSHQGGSGGMNEAEL